MSLACRWKGVSERGADKGKKWGNGKVGKDWENLTHMAHVRLHLIALPSPTLSLPLPLCHTPPTLCLAHRRASFPPPSTLCLPHLLLPACKPRGADLEPSGELCLSLMGHLSGIYTLSLHPTLDVLVMCGRDVSVGIWDMCMKAQISFWTHMMNFFSLFLFLFFFFCPF